MDDEALEHFKAITQASDETANFYVAAADGDVQRAVDMYFNGEKGSAGDNVCCCTQTV